MFKRKLVISSMIMLMLMTLTACGEAMYELTPEEEGAIVSYSARVVAKFNNFQSDGLVFVPAKELEAEEVAEEPVSIPEETISEETEETVIVDEEIEETEEEKPAAFGADQTYNEKPAAEPVKNDTAGTKTDLSTALSLGNVEASYTGYDISKDYTAENVFSMTADAGKVFFAVKVRLHNTGSQTADIDMLAKRPSFGLLINGEREAVAMTTVLLDDLGTYQGSLRPQESIDTVIIFAVPEDIQSRMNTIGLRVLCDSVKSDVEF